ncbi:RNA-directed DNA polymerase from mobile element jockey [Merluccius polli]|uniref:RNA-directed DNA polymerase from mobile element jockey n=1 Tax=Merluccius polli TaxID=89951 RepID=A0AA47P388_MERPO|nr:RNA-directed DNA polymerase from mobile element jockey [Merluccius polli]
MCVGPDGQSTLALIKMLKRKKPEKKVRNFQPDWTDCVRGKSWECDLSVIGSQGKKGSRPLLYTNECRASTSTHTFFKYADDTAIVGYLNPDGSVLTSFEEEVSNFTKWCRDNFLAVNANKTKEMVIDFRRHKSEIPNSTVNDKTIERVSSYKYLGIEIDDKLKFEICTTSKVNKLQQRMFFLRKLNYFQVDCTILELFYKTVLQSVLSFGLVCVFGNMRKGNQDKLQRLLKTASKIIGCSQTSVTQLWADLVVDKAERILRDPTHPLYRKFQLSNRGSSRLLQRSIKTKRFSLSFVPSAIRLFNERHRSRS